MKGTLNLLLLPPATLVQAASGGFILGLAMLRRVVQSMSQINQKLRYTKAVCQWHRQSMRQVLGTQFKTYSHPGTL